MEKGILGKIDGIKIMVSPFVPEDTFIINEKTWDKIKSGFPDAFPINPFKELAEDNLEALKNVQQDHVKPTN